MALLNVDKLSVHFGDESAPFRAVDRISYSVKQGEVVGIVGESGSGKSVSSLAIMGLIDYPGRVMAEKLEFNGQDLQRISEKERRNLVGAEVAMIFQDPMTSLNPCYTVGFQIMEAIKVHQGGNKSTRRQRAIDLLNQVGIPDPASRLDVYPHQLSGGMSQRVMIAMAIACRPKLLIADEPTTALDVTIQAQIIELLLELQQKENMALVLITHDLALVAEAAHKIIVMYAGQVVENVEVLVVILDEAGNAIDYVPAGSIETPATYKLRLAFVSKDSSALTAIQQLKINIIASSPEGTVATLNANQSLVISDFVVGTESGIYINPESNKNE